MSQDGRFTDEMINNPSTLILSQTKNRYPKRKKKGGPIVKYAKIENLLRIKGYTYKSKLKTGIETIRRCSKHH